MSKVTRVATTVTNVKENTLGALAPHNLAAMDALHTAREQLRLAHEDGRLSYADLNRALRAIDEVHDMAYAGWKDAMDSDRSVR